MAFYGCLQILVRRDCNDPPQALRRLASSAKVSAYGQLTREDQQMHGKIVVGVDGSTQADEVTESIRRALSDAVRRKSAETPVEGRVLEFSGARLTDEPDLDAMVVGCHRRGRLARFLSGSVSAETVRTASYPVIVVPFDERSSPRPRWPALATL